MACDPGCCCCCKVCNRCHPSRLYLKILNVVIPTCVEGGSPDVGFCGCNSVEAWLEGQIAYFDSTDFCYNWSATQCPNTACNTMDIMSSASGVLQYEFPCSLARDIELGCVCNLDPSTPIVQRSAFSVDLHLCCLSPDVEETGTGTVDDNLAGTIRFAPAITITARSANLGEATCCWGICIQTPDFCGTWANYGCPSGPVMDEGTHLGVTPSRFRGTWTTDGPVCSADGDLVEQLWHVVTEEGVEFDLLLFP